MAKRYRAASDSVSVAILVNAIDVDSGKTVDHRESNLRTCTSEISGKSGAVDVVHCPDQHVGTVVQGKLIDGPTKPHIGLATAVQDDRVSVGNVARGIGVGRQWSSRTGNVGVQLPTR